MKRTALWIIFLLIFVVCCASLSACNFHIHAYGEWTVVKAANCTQDGQQERYCSCGEKQTVTINATGHTFDDWTVIKQASCSEVGQQERTCSCGEKESATIPVLPHTFGAWTTVRESTCTQKGKEERVCSCGEKETRDIDFAAHPYTAVVTGPTCTEQGYTTHTCGNCGHSYIDTYVEALGHAFGDWITDTEPTCTQEGSKHRVCSTCGYSEAETIPVKDHAYGEWTVVRESTCTQKGQEERVCGCGAKETRELELAAHTEEILPAVDATCTTTGLTQGVHCTACNELLTAQQIIEALGHSFTNYVSDNNATCTADGTKTAQCDRCDETDTINDVGSAKGHAYSDEWSMDDTYHWHVAICEHSSNVQNKAVHDWNEGVVTLEPTETTDGEMTYTCKVCGKTKITVVEFDEFLHTVTFVDYDGIEIKTQVVSDGESATPPADPEREGWLFTGWDVEYTNVSSDLLITAQYRIKTYTVTFTMPDETEIGTQTVNHGDSAAAPMYSDEFLNGKVVRADEMAKFPRMYFDFSNNTASYFSGWSDSFNNITENKVITAEYNTPYDKPVIFVQLKDDEQGKKLIVEVYCYCPTGCYIYGIEFAFDWKGTSGYISKCELPNNREYQDAQYYNDKNKSFKYMMTEKNGLPSDSGYLHIVKQITFSDDDGFRLTLDKINIATNCTIIYGTSEGTNVEDLVKITPIIVVK